eukprot:3328219-Pyramimonas_sp.AAC.1
MAPTASRSSALVALQERRGQCLLLKGIHNIFNMVAHIPPASFLRPLPPRPQMHPSLAARPVSHRALLCGSQNKACMFTDNSARQNQLCRNTGALKAFLEVDRDLRQDALAVLRRQLLVVIGGPAGLHLAEDVLVILAIPCAAQPSARRLRHAQQNNECQQ